MVSISRSFRTVCLVTLTVSMSAAAHAQAIRDTWGFQPQNRASLAVAMHQVENANASANAVTGLANSGVTQLVCGDSGTNATANSTCVIMNNSAGEIRIGQDSDGDQTATNTTSSATNTVQTGGSVEDVLNTLNSNN